MTFLVGGTRGLETSAFFVEKMTKNDCSPPRRLLFVIILQCFMQKTNLFTIIVRLVFFLKGWLINARKDISALLFKSCFSVSTSHLCSMH